MCIFERCIGDSLYGIGKHRWIFLPSWKICIEELLHFWRSPINVVHAVGDSINTLILKHVARNTTVDLRHTTCVATHGHRKLCHAQRFLPGNLLDVPWQIISGDLVCEIVGEHVVAGLHRSVRRERTGLFDFFVFEFPLPKQFQREERTVTFIHVVRTNICVPQRAQHANASNAQHKLLANTHGLISTIQVFGNRAIFLIVLG